MKLGKKSIGIFLCLASVFTVLAGCKKKTKKNTTKNNTTSVTTKTNTTKTNTTKINTTKVNTTKTTTKQKTTVDPKKKYMVNEDIFNSYFHITDFEALSKLNLTATYTYTSYSVVDNGVAKYDGKIYFDEFSSSDTMESSCCYYCVNEISDDSIVDFRCVDYDDGDVDVEYDITGIKSYLNEYIFLPFMNFTDLTFNRSTNSYEATEIEKDGISFNNVKIQFENNILKSYSFEYVSDYTFTYEATISNVGNTKADSVIRNAVSEDEFDSFFNINNINNLYDLNFTLEYNDGLCNYSLEYANGNALSETYFDDEFQSKKYYEITDEDGGNVVYDLYYVDADGKWRYDSEKNKDIDDFVWDVLYLHIFDYDKFVFNEETGYYECDNYTLSDGEYSNLKIKFVDGLLDSFTANVDDGSEYDVTLDITNAGTTEVVAPVNKYTVDEETFNSFLGISSYEELKALNYTCDYVDKWGSQTVYASNGTFMAIKHSEGEDDETYLYQTSASTTKDVELKISTYSDSTWHQTSTMNLTFFAFLRDYGRMLQIDYSSFAYDEVEKCYKLGYYEVDLNQNYTDIKVSLEYGKISSLSYTVNNYSSWDVAVTFTNVGNTNIVY